MTAYKATQTKNEWPYKQPPFTWKNAFMKYLNFLEIFIFQFAMNSPDLEFSYEDVRAAESELGLQLQSTLFDDITYQIPVEAMNNDILEEYIESS